jgi:hypothetical protein
LDDERRAKRLARRVLSVLASYRFRSPIAGETEPAYTARVLMPALRSALQSADLRQVVLSGDGITPAPSVAFWGLEFKPDIALSLDGRRLCAFEVKYLSVSARQDSLTKAIGQAHLYRILGYPAVCVWLIERSPLDSGVDSRLDEFLVRSNIGIARLVSSEDPSFHSLRSIAFADS